MRGGFAGVGGGGQPLRRATAWRGSRLAIYGAEGTKVLKTIPNAEARERVSKTDT